MSVGGGGRAGLLSKESMQSSGECSGFIWHKSGWGAEVPGKTGLRRPQDVGVCTNSPVPPPPSGPQNICLLFLPPRPFLWSARGPAASPGHSCFSVRALAGILAQAPNYPAKQTLLIFRIPFKADVRAPFFLLEIEGPLHYGRPPHSP